MGLRLVVGAIMGEPREKEEDGHAARQCAGEAAVIDNSLLQTGTTRSREGVTGSGSPVMGPKALPGSESHAGKTRKSLRHH